MQIDSEDIITAKEAAIITNLSVTTIYADPDFQRIKGEPTLYLRQRPRQQQGAQRRTCFVALGVTTNPALTFTLRYFSGLGYGFGFNLSLLRHDRLMK